MSEERILQAVEKLENRIDKVEQKLKEHEENEREFYSGIHDALKECSEKIKSGN